MHKGRDDRFTPVSNYKTGDWALTAARTLSTTDSNELLLSRIFRVRTENIADVAGSWGSFRIVSCNLGRGTYPKIRYVGSRDVGELSRKTEVGNDLPIV